ncbi:hypothetical protein EBZ80_24460, partial [bacterium]|nr:hypothetical protein [bacterium]
RFRPADAPSQSATNPNPFREFLPKIALPSGPDPELFVLAPSGNPLYIANEDDSRSILLGNQLVIIEQARVYETRWLSASVNEDQIITLEVYLTTAPAFNVTVTLEFGNQWESANGSTTGSTSLTFTPSNFNVGQSILLKPVDDLTQSLDRLQTVNLLFNSSDSGFNGLSETLSVNVIDNDFQRSTDTLKLPSDGNN